MRSSITLVLSALLSLATISLASAEAVKVPRVILPTSNTSVPSQPPEYEISGFTAEQQNAIPYRPCTQAVGWVNGRLHCYN